MDELRHRYPNDNTYYKEMIGLINMTKKMNIEDKEHTLRIYRDELVRLKAIRENKLEEQIATTIELEKFMSTKDMKKYWNKMPPSVDKLMLGFYLFYPPLRSDWASVEIIDDKFVFNKFLKVKDIEKDLTKEIVPELRPLLKYVDEIIRNNKNFCKKLIRITTKVFGKKIGVNMFRKIHIFEHKDDSIKDRKLLAEQMNHTIDTSRLYYEKKNFK